MVILAVDVRRFLGEESLGLEGRSGMSRLEGREKEQSLWDRGAEVAASVACFKDFILFSRNSILSSEVVSNRATGLNFVGGSSQNFTVFGVAEDGDIRFGVGDWQPASAFCNDRMGLGVCWTGGGLLARVCWTGGGLLARVCWTGGGLLAK